MSSNLAPIVVALSELTERELHALIAATNEVPQIAPHLLAWIDRACDWELNRRAGREFDLQPPESAIPPEDDADGIDAAIALRTMFAKDSRAAHQLFDAVVGMLTSRRHLH